MDVEQVQPQEEKYFLLMIAVSNDMYVYIIFPLEAYFVLKVWLYFVFIIGRYGRFFEM